ncbi:XdhC family protein [Sphingomonas phyllosphaerae]|uniref:XdhC family protein n=1 Tax=Sphingomonas phyllosphaerae TaxID=257003 RepID=UPI000686B9FF|nr:XdhC family protein [Sphingomonas phyllosphaerae]
MKNALSIFRFLLEAEKRGERTALVTLTDVTGGSSRSPGAHIAVSETGQFVGSFSGGCIEAAVVGEARRVIESGTAELIRFGAGSQFIDIRLPCGGGVDLLFTPCMSAEAIRQAYRSLVGRSPVSVLLGRDGTIAVSRGAERLTRWAEDIFVARHEPDLRILIAGHGAEVPALAMLSSAYGAEVIALSPDHAIVEALTASGLQATALKTPDHIETLLTDAFTAVILLFHDHDWEPVLLEQALRSAAFFVGAMGSRGTHRERIAMLRRRGLAEEEIARLTGPIGLIPASRDPDTLALSVLSQVVARHHQAGDQRRLPVETLESEAADTKPPKRLP